MSVRTKYFEKLRMEETLAEFFLDKYEYSMFGFLKAYTEEFMLIEKYEDDGTYDGISILLRTNVSRIRWLGNSIESIDKLIDPSQRPKKVTPVNLASVDTILQSVNKIFNQVTVHIEDIDSSICFIGQLQEMNPSTVVLHEFGTTKSLDRSFILLAIEDITRIDGGGKYENRLKKLFGTYNNKD